jgi:hypothetical protein
MSMLQNFGLAFIAAEQYILNQFQWPSWAFRVIMILLIMIAIVSILEYFASPSLLSPSSEKAFASKAFKWFQAQYLTVYFVVMLADWLQGTNMYTLYSSYGVHVGMLFLTGFLSSAVFGTFLGIYIDSWGRKFGCILFCVLEVESYLFVYIFCLLWELILRDFSYCASR